MILIQPPENSPSSMSSPSSQMVIVQSTGSSPLSDGYAKQARGTLMSSILSFSGFPVTGTLQVMDIRDGPIGKVLARLPLSGDGIHGRSIRIPMDIENGIYISGLSGMTGDERVDAQFSFQEIGPDLPSQDSPR